jgi:hypothetical protein
MSWENGKNNFYCIIIATYEKLCILRFEVDDNERGVNVEVWYAD